MGMAKQSVNRNGIFQGYRMSGTPLPADRLLRRPVSLCITESFEKASSQ